MTRRSTRSCHVGCYDMGHETHQWVANTSWTSSIRSPLVSGMKLHSSHAVQSARSMLTGAACPARRITLTVAKSQNTSVFTTSKIRACATSPMRRDNSVCFIAGGSAAKGFESAQVGEHGHDEHPAGKEKEDTKLHATQHSLHNRSTLSTQLCAAGSTKQYVADLDKQQADQNGYRPHRHHSVGVEKIPGQGFSKLRQRAHAPGKTAR